MIGEEGPRLSNFGGCHALGDVGGQNCREGGLGGLQFGPRGLSLSAADPRQLHRSHLGGARLGGDPPGDARG